MLAVEQSRISCSTSRANHLSSSRSPLLNILYAVHAYKPAYRVGGPVVSVSAAAEALVRLGHRVTVFTTNSNLDQDLDVPTDRPVDVDGVEVWYFRREEPLRHLPLFGYFTRSIGYMYCPAMRGALDRVMPAMDLVDTHMPFVYPTFAAARAAIRHRVALFYHQRGNFDPERLRFRGFKKRIYIRLAERPVMERATTLVALTEAERRSFSALVNGVPVEVVPNGVDVPTLRPDAADRVETRFGIPASALLVLFLGRLHPTKGAETLLDAFARVAPAVPDATLVMAGPDEWQLESKWRSQLPEEVRRRVMFPGMVSGEDKMDLLARADLFSLPSIGEGFSMAVLEALASRTAVMLSPGCHFPEVEDGGGGVIVPADPPAMAATMLKLLADRAALHAMGTAARQLVVDRYSWDRIAEQLAAVYTKGIDRHRRQ